MTKPVLVTSAAGGRQVRIEGQPIARIQFTPTVDFDWDPNGLFHIEQAYAQWFVPADRRLRHAHLATGRRQRACLQHGDEAAVPLPVRFDVGHGMHL